MGQSLVSSTCSACSEQTAFGDHHSSSFPFPPSGPGRRAGSSPLRSGHATTPEAGLRGTTTAGRPVRSWMSSVPPAGGARRLSRVESFIAQCWSSTSVLGRGHERDHAVAGIFLAFAGVGEDGLQVEAQFRGLLLAHLAHLFHDFVFFYKLKLPSVAPHSAENKFTTVLRMLLPRSWPLATFPSASISTQALLPLMPKRPGTGVWSHWPR